MSHVYMGRGADERAGHAVVIDHESKRFYDVLEGMHNSSVGNLDLALHVSLTTAMSSSSMDATRLEFVRQKEVKAQGRRDESRIQGDEENKKSRSRQRRCAWPGTTYKMQNFSMEAQFRPVVNPDRKLKQLPTGKDTPFEEVQQFVEHLQSSVPHGTDKKISKMKHKHSNSGSNASNDNAGRTLRLEKGRKLEMHLDVMAGDTIRWEFFSKSSDFCFMATYFHEDQQQPVCRTDGVKNMKIVDYFKLYDTTNESKDHTNGNQQEAKKKPSFFKMFEDKKQSQQPASTTCSSRNNGSEVAFGMKNTFRSLTLVPGTRHVRKDFEAKVVMTESFPFQLRDFLPVIKFISTTGEHVKNLEEFFQMTLPPGFPVKFELPMMFTIRVAYTFQKITLNPQLDAKMFEIPSDYHEVFTLDEVRS
uniref:Ankyrin repeat domain-containing protein n=1 Tax=Phytophthora ramorum TaxID=164328 RepID=H3H6N7_PHYRM